MSSPTGEPSWLDEQHPHEPRRSAAQINALLGLLRPPPRRLLDLGCGAGRVLLPLARAGHRVVGLDRDPRVLADCAARLSKARRSAELIEADFLDDWPAFPQPFDAVCLLGNTIMAVHDVDAAVQLMRRARDALASGGCFIIDDTPRDFWPQLTEGNWLAGISEGGDAQLLWEEGDAVFALRQGDAVDPLAQAPEPRDRRFRLWSLGALRLAAHLAALSAPEGIPGSTLLIMRRAAERRPHG